MSDTDAQVPLPDLNAADAPAVDDIGYNEDENALRVAADLEAVFDVPVQVSAVLGRSKMDVGELLKLGPGTVLELDRRVGESIDIYVNNRLVARGDRSQDQRTCRALYGVAQSGRNLRPRGLNHE